MRKRLFFFTLLQAINCLSIFDTYIWIHPVEPNSMLIASIIVSSLISIFLATSLKLRILASSIGIIFICVTLVRSDDWHQFEQNSRDYTEVVSGMIKIKSKIKNYNEHNPSDMFTNFYDYVKGGVLNSNDLMFLQDASFFLPQVNDDRVLIVQKGNLQFVMLRNGTIYKSKN